MAGTMRDFAAFCDALPKDLKAAVNERKKVIALNIANDLTQTTPIDTGAAISNWKLSVGTPDLDVIAPHAPSNLGLLVGSESPGGPANAAVAMELARAAVAIAQYGETVYCSNGLDYIGLLNENGTSPQAAPGFVERAIIFARDLADRAKLTF